MMEWLGSTLSHRDTAGWRTPGNALAHALLYLLAVLMTATAAQAGRVPVRPNRHPVSKQLQVPVASRRRAARKVDAIPPERRRENARSDGNSKPSIHNRKKRNAETHTQDKGSPRGKAAPRGKGRKPRTAEPDDDPGVELKRAKGRPSKGRARAPQGVARGLDRLSQPRWRVHEVPPPSVLEGANLAPLPRTPAKALPSVSANVPAATALTPEQQADLSKEFREAGVLEDADDTAAVVDTSSLLHPTRSQLASEAELPMVLPGTYRDGRMVVGPLRGSREVLIHQNLMADDAGLDRIRNDAQLARLRGAHKLVDFAEGNGLAMNPPLPWNRRCARPWTVRFAADIAKAYSTRFGEPLVVTSAVRTISYQLRLQRVNGNAAAVDGDGASPHLTGQALDFGKRGMDGEKLSWMRAYLLPLMQAGKIDVEEEFQQACFHISVYRSYAPVKARSSKVELAQATSLPKIAPMARRANPIDSRSDDDLQ